MIPLLIVPCFGLALQTSDVPKLFLQDSFNARDLAQAMNYFVALGEERASQKLASLSHDRWADFRRSGRTGFSRNERIAWVCRILYQPKGNEPLRPPAFGGIASLPNAMPLAEWPLYPLALSGDTYFVLGRGYSLAGRPEFIGSYTFFCRKHGVFRKAPVAVPDKWQALKDFELLTNSKKWKALVWPLDYDTTGRGVPVLENLALKFIKAQAEGIPQN
jgi:hypothetical protein